MYYVKFREDSKDSLLRALMDLTRLENLKGSKFSKKLSTQNTSVMTLIITLVIDGSQLCNEHTNLPGQLHPLNFLERILFYKTFNLTLFNKIYFFYVI